MENQRTTWECASGGGVSIAAWLMIRGRWVNRWREFRLMRREGSWTVTLSGEPGLDSNCQINYPLKSFRNRYSLTSVENVTELRKDGWKNSWGVQGIPRRFGAWAKLKVSASVTLNLNSLFTFLTLLLPGSAMLDHLVTALVDQLINQSISQRTKCISLTNSCKQIQTHLYQFLDKCQKSAINLMNFCHCVGLSLQALNLLLC